MVNYPDTSRENTIREYLNCFPYHDTIVRFFIRFIFKDPLRKRTKGRKKPRLWNTAGFLKNRHFPTAQKFVHCEMTIVLSKTAAFES